MNAHDAITLEKQDKVAIITMKDASGLNLFNEEIVRGLARVQDEIDDDKQIRAVVLRSGNDHFSAGVDLAFLKTVNPRFIKDNLVFLQRTFGRWQDLQMPVIVGISGLCYGAGMELILGCDLRGGSALCDSRGSPGVERRPGRDYEAHQACGAGTG
jgi:enoyl-CoA hydratase